MTRSSTLRPNSAVKRSGKRGANEKFEHDCKIRRDRAVSLSEDRRAYVPDCDIRRFALFGYLSRPGPNKREEGLPVPRQSRAGQYRPEAAHRDQRTDRGLDGNDDYGIRSRQAGSPQPREGWRSDYSQSL